MTDLFSYNQILLPCSFLDQTQPLAWHFWSWLWSPGCSGCKSKPGSIHLKDTTEGELSIDKETTHVLEMQFPSLRQEKLPSEGNTETLLNQIKVQYPKPNVWWNDSHLQSNVAYRPTVSHASHTISSYSLLPAAESMAHIFRAALQHLVCLGPPCQTQLKMVLPPRCEIPASKHNVFLIDRNYLSNVISNCTYSAHSELQLLCVTTQRAFWNSAHFSTFTNYHARMGKKQFAV